MVKHAFFLLVLVSGGLHWLRAGNEEEGPKGDVSITGVHAILHERPPSTRPSAVFPLKPGRPRPLFPSLSTASLAVYSPHAASAALSPVNLRPLVAHPLIDPQARPSTVGGDRPSRPKINPWSLPATPTSVDSASISLASSSGRESRFSDTSGRRLRKQSSIIERPATSQSLGAVGVKKERARLSTSSLPVLHAAESGVATGGAGAVVSIAPLDLGGTMAVSLSSGGHVLLPDVPTEADELYFVCDFEWQTFEKFKSDWINMRHMLYVLRKRLMGFRAHYTRMVKRGKTDAFIAECNERDRMTDPLSRQRRAKAFNRLEDINVVYGYARTSYEEALIHAEKICMGFCVDCSFSAFDARHALPADGVAFSLLGRPLCMDCSGCKGSRVIHAGFDEDSLSFDDECPVCAGSFLRQMYDDEMVYDPVVFCMIKAPDLMRAFFAKAREACSDANFYLNSIFYDDKRSL